MVVPAGQKAVTAPLSAGAKNHGIRRVGRVQAGQLLAIASGSLFIIGAFLPWAQLYDPNKSYTAIQLGLYGPMIVVLVLGAALITGGVIGRGWSAFVAIGAAIAAVIVELAIHPDEYQALTRLGAQVGGDIGHVGGFGTTVIFAAAGLAVIAAVTTAIEAEPQVVTSMPEPE
jgi:hypothetical protein